MGSTGCYFYPVTSLLFSSTHASANIAAIQNKQLSANSPYCPESTSSCLLAFMPICMSAYPVFCWTEDYGLFVIALPQGSLWKYNFYSAPEVILNLVRSILPVGLGLLAVGLSVCLLHSDAEREAPRADRRFEPDQQAAITYKNAPDSLKDCRGHYYWEQKNHLFRDDFQPGD